MKGRFVLVGVIASVLLLAIVGLSTAQGPEPADNTPSALVGTAFTYQGQLKKDGKPVTAVCDFRFKLYTAPILGSQVGTTQIESFQVTDGLFTVELNGANEFGSTAFQGNARYLGIEVKCPGDADYSVLSPRQELTATPYALGLALPYTGKSSSAVGTDIFVIQNTGSGRALHAIAGSDTAIWGVSSGGVAGVDGRNTTGAGVYGAASEAGGIGVSGLAIYIGVRGESSGTVNAVGVGGIANAAACTSGLGGCYGVQGISAKGRGVAGDTVSGMGVYGYSDGTGTAVYAQGQYSGNLIEAWHGPLFPDREFYVDSAGEVYADGQFHPGGADLAEMLPAVDGLEPGDVLVVGADGKLARSTQPYQVNVIGVYSTKPGFIGGAEDGADLSGKVPLAVAGVVPVKVSAENGPVHPGDALTSSSTPGYAMKAKAITVDGITFYPSGVVIGKALESLERGTGVILMLIVLQ